MFAFAICLAVVFVVLSLIFLAYIFHGSDSILKKRANSGIVFCFLAFVTFVGFWVMIGLALLSGSIKSWKDVEEPAVIVNGVLVTVLVSSMRYLFRIEKRNRRNS